MQTKKRRSGRFGRALLIYILIFALLASAVLVAFRQYLAAYEASRATTVLHRYLDACADGTLSYPWGLALGKIDSEQDGSSDSRIWAQEKIRNATIREQLGSSSEEKTYALYDENGVCFETVTLRQTGKGRMGFPGWQVAEENVSLAPYTTSVSLVIPEDYTVMLNGEALDPAFIVEKGIPYEALKPFENDIKTPPQKMKVQFGPVLGAGEVTVLDRKGQLVPEDQQNEFCYLNTANAADRARVQAFAESYLAAYLPYADDLNGGGMSYFWDVYTLIVHGGELEARIRQAQDGFEYGNVQKIEILSVNLDCCTDLGGGRYFADFGYHIRTYGLHDPTEEDYRMRLLIVEENGALLAEQMYLS